MMVIKPNDPRYSSVQPWIPPVLSEKGKTVLRFEGDDDGPERTTDTRTETTEAREEE